MNECRMPLVYCVPEQIKDCPFNRREREEAKIFIDRLYFTKFYIVLGKRLMIKWMTVSVKMNKD